jgi:rhamnulokinase
MSTLYLACDLGAESGRLMLGTLSAGRLALEEIHRFANTPVHVNGSLCWNIAGLFDGLEAGLRKAGTRDERIASISTDSWGLDYVLLDERGRIIEPTFHYRDSRTERGVAATFAKVPWPAVFAETGIQFMPINTIYQLAAEAPERLTRARQLLMIADAFNHHLGGIACAEVSLASTSQLYNPRKGNWSAVLLEALGLPKHLFPKIVPCGARLGRMRRTAANQAALDGTEIIATCSHDTGAAVAAVPAEGERWAYISSGTWSLIGVERATPVINDLCRELNFTNEIGHGGTVRLLKNVIGLWLVQECRRAWAQAGREFDYATLAEMAAAAPPFVSLVNPADPRFLPPGDMPARLAAFCRESGQPEPASPGAMIRCALESLALLYRRRLEELQQLVGHRIDRIHIVGGGSRNPLLNQFTADALQLPVHAGPVEATALGNVLLQAIALGQITSLAAAREIVRASFSIETFTPRDASAWDAAYARFRALPGG